MGDIVKVEKRFEQINGKPVVLSFEHKFKINEEETVNYFHVVDNGTRSYALMLESGSDNGSGRASPLYRWPEEIIETLAAHLSQKSAKPAPLAEWPFPTTKGSSL